MEYRLSACQAVIAMLKALKYLYVFRVVVVGGCLGLLVFAWVAHIQWLMMASACIAIGEYLESSYYIIVLRWAQRTGRLANAGRGRWSA
jgi:hypothetical protein